MNSTRFRKGDGPYQVLHQISAIRLLLLPLVGLLNVPVPGHSASAREATATRSVTVSNPQEGYSYTSVIRQQSTEKGKVKQEPTLRLYTETRGERARVEVLEGGDPKSLNNGDYFLTLDGGKSFLVVSPARREWRETTLEKLGGEVDTGKARLSVKDFRMSPAANPQAGEALLGVATERQRLERRYTVTARVLLWKSELRFQESVEFWTSPALVAVPQPALSYLNVVATALLAKANRTHGEEARQRVAATCQQGMVLKAVWNTTIYEGKDPTETVMTMEVNDLKPGMIPLERFEIPAHFKKKR